MRPLLVLLSLAASLVLSFSALAHSGDYVIHRDPDGVVLYEKITIQFDLAGEDIGRPGAYFIGLEGDHGNYYVQTPQGWEKFQGGIPNSYLDVPSLSGTLSLVLFETGKVTPAGSNQTICDTLRNQTGSDKVNIWLGYGVLLPEHEERIATMHKINNPRMTPDHLRRFYVFETAGTDNRTSKVLSLDCTPPVVF